MNDMKNLTAYTDFKSIKESEGVKTWVVMSTVKRSDWKNSFNAANSGKKAGKIKKLIDTLAGQEIPEPKECPTDPTKWIIETGDPEVPTLEIPKRLVVTGALKPMNVSMKASPLPSVNQPVPPKEEEPKEELK